jgi:hypothetical protein
MDIVISLAGSQLIITVVAVFIALWYWRQLRWLRDEVASLHKELARFELRLDVKSKR